MSYNNSGKPVTILHNDRGSILVGTVAFAIIMAIAGSGLLMLAANSVNREQAALDDDRALLAAESGLRIGLRWLADAGNWDAYHASGLVDFHIAKIGEMYDTVSLVIDEGDPVLKSRATCPGMEYLKEISCIVELNSSASRVLFNTLDADNGLDNIWFDGPVHSNEPILLAGSSYPGAKRGSVYFVNGPVTTTNVGGTRFGYGTGLSGNNYDYGIEIVGLTGDGTQGQYIDSYFDNTFTHSRDALAMPNFDVTGIAPLPQNQSMTTRAVLYFDTISGIGQARYYYYDAAGDLAGMVPIPNIDGQIIRAQNPISVLGVVKGNATVVTDPGCSIFPVGDLIYADFDQYNSEMRDECDNYDNRNNYHVGLGGDNNFLALVSGGNIHFDQSYQMYITNPNDGTLAPTYPTPTFQPTIFLTASLIAAGPGMGIVWNTDNGILNLPFYNYDIRAIGSRTINTFFNYTREVPAANDRFRFLFDRRLLNNLSAPGLPPIQRITNAGINLYLLKTVWRERNIPK
ncbi:MAG: hypothetical protein JW913_08000 [Chitinispirillaceae bacterium]|nr:hypothetical protein [Chitinispirillaceae bacterium]